MQKTKKVARAGTASGRSGSMTVVLRDKPPTYDWGWFSREDPRMHLQTVDKDHRRLHYKVWLEKGGKRVFEPEEGIPAKVLKALQTEVDKQRGRIEIYWIIFMIKRGWLKVRLKDGVITFMAYPSTPNHFERSMLLSDVIPNVEVAKKVTAQDVVLNDEFGMLEIFPKRDEAARDHLPLEEILWD